MSTIPDQMALRLVEIKNKLNEIDELMGQLYELYRDGRRDCGFPYAIGAHLVEARNECIRSRVDHIDPAHRLLVQCM